eukprot:1147647-Pelagomonas_calceolata.AAC.1
MLALPVIACNSHTGFLAVVQCTYRCHVEGGKIVQAQKGSAICVPAAEAPAHQQPPDPCVPDHPNTVWKESSRAGHALEA